MPVCFIPEGTVYVELNSFYKWFHSSGSINFVSLLQWSFENKSLNMNQTVCIIIKVKQNKNQ